MIKLFKLKINIKLLDKYKLLFKNRCLFRNLNKLLEISIIYKKYWKLLIVLNKIQFL
jgi:hypothetical protein